MQAIIFMGVQATGKSSFYKKYFFNSHMRISLDLLNTRNKEWQFMQTCLATEQKFVVDNTNPSKTDRKRYIDLIKPTHFELIGYYFESKIKDAMQRNALRMGKEKIPEKGLLGVYNRLEMPNYEEGFDKLFYVQLREDGFVINDWKK